MKYDSIIIAGPTASGKSGFAHELARTVNGAIINADSVQIYRGIENISASPFVDGKCDEIDGVPYKLFSVFDLNKHISVDDYLTLAKNAYDEVIAMGKTPIFVGGTGYYINAIINGISNIPEIDEILSPALAIVPLQLLAYYISEFLGKDVDQPRNLAKSVTVE